MRAVEVKDVLEAEDRTAIRRQLLEQLDDQAAADARSFAALMRAVASVFAEHTAIGTVRAFSDGVIELAATLRVSQGKASALGSDAVRLTTVLTRTLQALEAGMVLRPSVELFLRTVHSRSGAVALRVEELVLTRLTVGTTTDQRRALLEAVVRAEAEVEPELAEQRERAAADLDNVWVSPMDDTGRAVVGANLDVLTARRWALDFEELVRATVAQDKAAGIKRSRSQVRAAVFAGLPSQIIALLKAVAAGRTDELLALTRLDPTAAATLGALADELTGQGEEGHNSTVPLTHDIPAPAAPAPVDDWFGLAGQLLSLKVRDPKTVNVFVPMTTLLDVDQRSAWVEGVGPVRPFRVRLLAGSEPLRRVVVDEHGQPQHWDPLLAAPLDLSQAQATAQHLRDRLLAMTAPVVVTDVAAAVHDAPVAVGALVKLRDATCTGIGCGTTSTSAHIELDHETPYDARAPYAGPTAVWNLASRTDRCHQAKHHGWAVERDPRTGTSTWVSPTGRTYSRPGVWPVLPPLPADLPEPHLAEPIIPLVEDDTAWAGSLVDALPLPSEGPAAEERPTHDLSGWEEGTAPRPPPDEPPF